MEPGPAPRNLRSRRRWVVLVVLCFGCIVWLLYPLQPGRKVDQQHVASSNSKDYVCDTKAPVKRVAIIGQYVLGS